MNLGIALSGDDGSVKIKHNPDALTPGSDIWQDIRQKQWQKRIGNQ